MKYLFVTDEWIAEAQAVHRIAGRFQKYSFNPVITASAPHEDGILAYGTVLREGARFRAWYQVFNRDNPEVSLPYRTAVGYAQSSDGIRWKKPSLGRFRYRGKDTNLVMLNSGRSSLFSPTVVRNLDRRIRSPYLMLYFDAMTAGDLKRYGSPFPPEASIPGWTAIEGEGLFLASSRDGIRWKKSTRPCLGGQNDSSVLTQLPDGRLFAAFKTSLDSERHFRIIGGATSADGKRWSEQKVLLRPDWNDPPGTEFYTLVPFMYDGNLLGLLSVYHNAPHDKSLSIQLVRARKADDPLGEWERANNRQPLLLPEFGDAWDGARVYPSSNLLVSPPQDPDNIWLYYGGANTTHDDRRHWRSGIGLAKCGLDEFGWLEAGHFRGHVRTRALPIASRDLALRLETGHGECAFEVREAGSDRLVHQAACDARFGAHTQRFRLPRQCVGAQARLVFRLRRAKLFSFSFL